MPNPPRIDLPGDVPAMDISEIKVEASADGGGATVQCLMEFLYREKPFVVVINMDPDSATELGHSLIAAAAELVDP